MGAREGIVSGHRLNGPHVCVFPYAQRYDGVKAAWLFDPDQCSTLGQADPYLPKVRWILDVWDAAG